MPGKSPYQAYEAFARPLASALSCLVRAKVTCSKGGKERVGALHTLYIGSRDDDYLRLNGEPRLELRARMQYEIIADIRAGYGPYRITTHWYDYSVRRQDGQAVIDYHWHPHSLSHEVRPHVHIGSTQLKPDAVLTNKAHMLTGRITFETVIRQLIEYGVEPSSEDWSDRLDSAEMPHLKYRTWSAVPPGSDDA